jgi:hypothetical protein
MTEDQIKHMVNRFLSWKLPETFNPDGGISFKRTFNENTPHPMKHEPSGTNLFDASQADAMVRHMLEGLPAGGAGGLSADLEEIEGLLDGYDWVGTGSGRDHSEEKRATLAWSRIKAALAAATA